MITVIIAGGSGTRLWPLSTNQYPKHLLKLTGEDSLLQATYERAKRLSKSIYVITESSHSSHVREQLSELSEDAFIVEPGRRGTASCIIAALHHIQSRHDKGEPIAFLSADHHIRDIDGFEHSFKIAGEISAEQGRIALVGVEPTYPATGFGYIQKDGAVDDDALVYNVLAFKEKPAFDVAQEYVQSGHYLWNCGYFVGSVSTFIKAMGAHSPELKENYEKLLKTDANNYADTYLDLENNTIDYALIEKVNDLLVVPASFDWMDVGSFADLHNANESDEVGNHIRGEGVELEGIENSYIRNEEGKPIAVIGLDNIVVVNTPHGLLVARKDLSQKVGDIAKKIQAKN
ncbi:MAG: mannose-1-phosphate guanylyltransferase [Candidatus Saccharimonadales bacterium]